MQQQNQIENKDAKNDDEEISTEKLAEIDEKQTASSPEADEQAKLVAHPRNGFDWVALIVALSIAAFFALTARFNSQPSPSFIPAAVFSATGCGLLVTALHKLRAREGVGLREAALAGFGMALFQFAITFTYPNVYTTITAAPEYGRAFLVTWGLIGLFAVVLSLAGAAIGHLAFAPLRPQPERRAKQSSLDEDEEEEIEDEEEEANESLDDAAASQPVQTTLAVEPEEPAAAQSTTEQAADEEAESVNEEEDKEEEPAGMETAERTRHSLVNYAVTILLLGLLPMMVGYVFAATYDFIMQTIHVDQISPALYPTLSLLGGLLPWRLAAPINLSSANGSFIIFTLLWRIPDSVLGNPNLFDVQTLEPFVFNAVGLAFLLITMYGSKRHENERRAAPWSIFLLLEALLGLVLILPANLWMLRGLEGLLQIQNLVAQLPTLHLINPTLFILNLVTGTLFCLLVGLIVRRQFQLWTAPRKEKNSSEEEAA